MRSSKLPECIVMVQTTLVQRRAFSFEIAGFRRAAARAVRRRPYAESRAPKGHGRSTAPGPEQPVGHGLALYKNGSAPGLALNSRRRGIKTAAASSRL